MRDETVEMSAGCGCEWEREDVTENAVGSFNALAEANRGFRLGGGCISTSSTFSAYLPGDERELNSEDLQCESYETGGTVGSRRDFRESKKDE
jgi:hypothetical protein